MKAAAFRRRHVAHRGPAGRQRQYAESTAAAAEPTERAASELDERVINGRPARHPGPQKEAGSMNRRFQLLGKFPLPPATHHLWQRDLDRSEERRVGEEGR